MQRIDLDEYRDHKRVLERLRPYGAWFNDEFVAAQARGDEEAMRDWGAKAGKWQKDMALLDSNALAYELENPGATFTPWKKGSLLLDEIDEETKEPKFIKCYHPGQAKMWNWYQRFLKGEAKPYCFVSGSNQSGKTSGGARIMWEALMQKEAQRFWGFATQFELSRDNQQLKLWDTRFWSEVGPKQPIFDDNKGFGDKEPALVVKRRGWTRPSIMRFKSYAAGAQAAESGTLKGIWCDEPPTMDILSSLYARVSRHKGFILITATFLDLDEVYENIIESGEWEIIEIPFLENPSQTQEEFDKLMRVWPENERQARGLGRPVQRAGRLFPEFRREPPYYVPIIHAPKPEMLCYSEAIDFHGGRDICYNLAGTEDKGQTWAMRELAYTGDLNEFCRLIWEARLNREVTTDEMERLKRDGWRLGPRESHFTPTFTLFNTHTNLIIHGDGATNRVHIPSILRDNGIFVTPYKSDPTQRATVLRQAIIGSYVPGNGRNNGPGTIAKNVPQLIITDACPLTAAQFNKALWDRHITKDAKRRHGEHKDQPMARDNDFVDNLGSIIEFIPKRPKRQETGSRSRFGSTYRHGGLVSFGQQAQRPSGSRVA